MAEIALLVAEDFERQRKKRISSVEEEVDDDHLFDMIREKIKQLSVIKTRISVEPKSPFGAAASDGFFSA